MGDTAPLAESIITGNWDRAANYTEAALRDGADPRKLVSEVLQPAMVVVGQRYSEGEYFLPDMLMAGRAMNSALAVLEPLLGQTGPDKIGRVVIGTVKGDVHDIGKNMVSMFLRGTGYDVIDLGVDVPDDRFVEAVTQVQPDIVALSALLTTTMPYFKTVVHSLAKAGLRDSVKVIVGGAPVTRNYADLIGADGYAGDAGAAAALCRRLVDRVGGER